MLSVPTVRLLKELISLITLMQVLLQPCQQLCSHSFLQSKVLEMHKWCPKYPVVFALPRMLCAHRGMGCFQHSNKAQPGTFSCAGASECLSLVTQSPECWCLARAVHSLCLKAETVRGSKELLKLGSSIGAFTLLTLNGNLNPSSFLSCNYRRVGMSIQEEKEMSSF